MPKQKPFKDERDTPKVELLVKPEPKRKDSFWFDGLVATVTRWDNTIEIHTQGAIRISFGEDQDMLCDKQAVEFARKQGYTDRKLGSSKNCWDNNNWFAFRLNTELSDEGCFIEATAGNLDDAIDLAKIFLLDLCKYVKF